MKILLAIDDSSHSERAIEFLTRMRWPAGSRMIVVSVIQPLVGVMPRMPALDAAEIAAPDPHRRLAESLVARAADVLRSCGFPTESCVLEGDPREGILHVAERERVDVIALGSRGRTGLAKLVLGSVSSHVVTFATCTVLVIKHPREH